MAFNVRLTVWREANAVTSAMSTICRKDGNIAGNAGGETPE